MTPRERDQVLVRVVELLEIADCLMQSVTTEDCYDIHNDIQDVKDSVEELMEPKND